MLRKYTLTGLVALSIAAAPVAAPTAMAKDNIDRLLMGLVAVGVVGAIAHEANKNKTQRVERHSPVYDGHKKELRKKKKRHHANGNRHRHGNVVHSHANNGNHYHKRNQDRDYKGRTGTHANKKLHKPRNCLRQRWTNQGWVKFYSKKCLRQHGY